MLADRPLRLAAVLVSALALTACAETTRTTPSSHATPRPVASVPATVNPAPTTPPPPSESASGTPAPTSTTSKPAASGNEVKASGVVFDPVTLKVKKGTKVTWTSVDGAHSVTSGTAKGGEDASGPMKSTIAFQTYSVTFDKAGTYKYFCIPHASLGMEGEIVVT